MSESALKNIKGVGEKTASALIRRFGSVEQIKHKTAAELAELDGISIAKAEYILEQLGAAKAEDSEQMDVDTPVKIDGDEE